jgi:putative nucleotidyltransferase with HDIG domain
MHPTPEDALALVREFNTNPQLVNHAVAVGAAMAYAARKRGEDERLWRVVGLVHDLDYERWPERHCLQTAEILREREWPEDIVRAVLSHGWGVCTDVPPASDLEKMLYAVDELTGLIAACALVRPSRSVMDLEVKSVRKKWKDKRFAAGVDREIIRRGAEMLGEPLDDLIADVIQAMRAVAPSIGL